MNCSKQLSLKGLDACKNGTESCQDTENISQDIKSPSQDTEKHLDLDKKSSQFRQAVDELTGTSNRRKDKTECNAGRDDFLKAVSKKCEYFQNVCDPIEVIADAYEIGQRQIQEGKSIHNPEAWMRKTIWFLLHNKSRRRQSRRKRYRSLDAPNSLGNGDEGLPLVEQLSSPSDSNNLYHLLDQADEEARETKKRERAVNSWQTLTASEQRILWLKKVENQKWEEIRQAIKFKGSVQALRKQGSRALSKARKSYKGSQA